MKKGTKCFCKVLTLLLAVAVVFSGIPFTAVNVGAANTTSVSDDSGYEYWTEIFKSSSGDLSTENGGGIWTDKSVYTDDTSFGSANVVKNEKNSFLVSLSTIASSMSIEGAQTSVTPTDTVIILDLSTSINNYVTSLATAANASIKTLVAANPDNRVCVLTYNSTVSTLMELGKYTAGSSGDFLTGSGTTIKIASGVKNTDTNTTISGSVSTSRGTNIQAGVSSAIEQLKSRTETSGRLPVVVLLTDGAPTLANTDVVGLTNGVSMPLNNNNNPGYSFATQLTMAYMKQVAFTDMLFYTIGVGNDVTDNLMQDVLNPLDEIRDSSLKQYWETFNSLDHTDSSTSNDSMTLAGNSKYVLTKNDDIAGLTNDYVSKVKNESNEYVNGYFAATSNDVAGDIQKAFESVMNEIINKSTQTTTVLQAVNGSAGSVSFNDKIGEYMCVTDVKGVVLADSLYNGATASQHIFANYTSLDSTVINNIQQNLGVSDSAVAEELIKKAVEAGQISYTNASSFSNYIGYYANAEGEYLGFYNDGETTLPESTGDASTDAAMLVKNYFFFGYDDSSNGVTKEDMLLSVINVQTDLATGNEIVNFSVPEKLLPIIEYNVKLDSAGNLTDLSVSGETNPIALVYETALNSKINEYNLAQTVSKEYIEQNKNSDGSVNFYSNMYDRDNTVGYGKDNTFSYFYPSSNNDRYYYLEEVEVYSDNQGTVYTGSEKPSQTDGDFYRQQIVYMKKGNNLSTDVIYHKLSETEVDAIEKSATSGEWVVPVGTVNSEHGNYGLIKTENITGTLTYSNKPFMDYDHPNVVEGQRYYIVGATLGNNGKLTLTPTSGIELSKSLATGATPTTQAFDFILENTTNKNDSSSYGAYKLNSDGTSENVTVKFTNGSATVSLKPDETLYIGDMSVGDVIKITEAQSQNYSVASVNSNTAQTEALVTVPEKAYAQASFVNRDKSDGSLKITKEIVHSFGGNYVIPEKDFEFELALSGKNTANASFDVVKSNSTIKTLVTDSNGKLTFTLKNGEEIIINGISDGVNAVLREVTMKDGFNVSYLENSVSGDGAATVVADTITEIKAVNTYTPAAVSVGNTISLTGEKTLDGRAWKDSDSFTFKLEKYENSNWVEMGTVSVLGTQSSKTFDLSLLMGAESYSAIGSYLYKVTEVKGPLGGVSYDATEHTFTVDVTDTDMDGYLEISSVTANNSPSTVVTKTSNGWNVETDFSNKYKVSGTANVSLGGEKTLIGKTMSDGDFTFELYQTDSNFTVSGNPLKTATNENSKYTFSLDYASSDVGNTYYYVVKEANAGEKINGVTYSSEQYNVTVTVEDDTVGGIKVTAVAENKNGVVNTENLNFANEYKAAATSTDITSEKELKGIRQLNANDFLFELYETDSSYKNPVLAATSYNNANGSVIFSNITLSEAKTYYFTVKENSQINVIDGVDYDDTVYAVKVDVKDNGNGSLYVDSKTMCKLDSAVTSVNEIKFVNTYTPAAVSVGNTVSLAGEKTLDGRAWKDSDSFTFKLEKYENSNWVEMGTVSVLGTQSSKTFDLSLLMGAESYSAIGSYLYKVTEVKGPLGGVSYDATEHTFTVDVTDTDMDGYLEISSVTANNSPKTVIIKSNSQWVIKADFANAYSVSGTAKAEFGGEKTLIGKTMADGDFTFELYQTNSSFNVAGTPIDASSNIGGKYGFTVNYTTADLGNTYYYVVKEANAGEKINGVTYSSEQYNVTVTVEDDTVGGMKVTAVAENKNGVVDSNSLDFTNTYKAAPAVASISGEKVLVGRELIADEFSFVLKETDSSFNEINGFVPVIAENDADGNIIFSNLTFTDAGKYYYIVEEDASASLERVTYDDTYYYVEISVVDNGLGQLVAEEPVITNAKTGDAAEKIVFSNIFTPRPDDIFVSFNINKDVTNTGTETISPEGFDFLVEKVGTDEKYTVTSDSFGDCAVELAFSEDDIGNTYTYEITEINNGREHVIYSADKYTVTVTISLDSNNVLVAELTQNGISTENVVAEFMNEYDYTPNDSSDDTTDGDDDDDTNGGGSNNSGEGSSNSGDSDTANKNNGVSSDSTVPKTGDTSNPLLSSIVLILGLFGLIFAYVSKKKEDLIEE